ncbi:hypothetical protein [Streptomyces cyaneus]|uniref:hypothetical protein n=1 Tax=Streptomyces cyaneus TaxID=1904 RepID=UPI0015E8E44F
MRQEVGALRTEFTGSNDLTEADRRLYTHIRRTLRSATPAGCVPPRNSWLTGHRDTPSPHCPRCVGPLRRSRLGGRTAVWCAKCQ